MTSPDWKAQLKAWWQELAEFPWRQMAGVLYRRFREARLGVSASSLTFTTVLALVPLFGNWTAASRHGETDTGEIERPVWVMFAAGDQEIRPFIANVAAGRKAALVEPRGDINRGKGLELLRSAGYRFTFQREAEGVIATACIPELFAIDPEAAAPSPRGPAQGKAGRPLARQPQPPPQRHRRAGGDGAQGVDHREQFNLGAGLAQAGGHFQCDDTPGGIAGQPVRPLGRRLPQGVQVLVGHRLDGIERRQAAIDPLRLQAEKGNARQAVGQQAEVQHVAARAMDADQRPPRRVARGDAHER